MSFNLNPEQELEIDIFNPGAAIMIYVDGSVYISGRLNYFHREVNVPSYAGAPTRILLPVYYDELESLTLWKPPSPASFLSVYAHAYLRELDPSNASRLCTLFSGWVTDSNPVGFPYVDRVDKEDCLANTLSLICTVAPAPAMLRAPLLGMPWMVQGFRGTFTASAVVANRNIGLGVDDGAGNYIQVTYNATNVTALQAMKVNGSNKYSQPFTSGLHMTIPLPDIIIRNPWEFSANVLNVQAGDTWSDCVVYVRPYVDY